MRKYKKQRVSDVSGLGSDTTDDQRIARQSGKTANSLRGGVIVTSYEEAVLNVVRNSLQNGAQHLSVYLDKDRLGCAVFDDGRGIERDILGSIFQQSQSFKAFGSGTFLQHLYGCSELCVYDGRSKEWWGEKESFISPPSKPNVLHGISTGMVFTALFWNLPLRRQVEVNQDSVLSGIQTLYQQYIGVGIDVYIYPQTSLIVAQYPATGVYYTPEVSVQPHLEDILPIWKIQFCKQAQMYTSVGFQACKAHIQCLEPATEQLESLILPNTTEAWLNVLSLQQNTPYISQNVCHPDTMHHSSTDRSYGIVQYSTSSHLNKSKRKNIFLCILRDRTRLHSSLLPSFTKIQKWFPGVTVEHICIYLSVTEKEVKLDKDWIEELIAPILQHAYVYIDLVKNLNMQNTQNTIRDNIGDDYNIDKDTNASHQPSTTTNSNTNTTPNRTFTPINLQQKLFLNSITSSNNNSNIISGLPFITNSTSLHRNALHVDITKDIFHKASFLCILEHSVLLCSVPLDAHQTQIFAVDQHALHERIRYEWLVSYQKNPPLELATTPQGYIATTTTQNNLATLPTSRYFTDNTKTKTRKNFCFCSSSLSYPPLHGITCLCVTPTSYLHIAVIDVFQVLRRQCLEDLVTFPFLANLSNPTMIDNPTISLLPHAIGIPQTLLHMIQLLALDKYSNQHAFTTYIQIDKKKLYCASKQISTDDIDVKPVYASHACRKAIMFHDRQCDMGAQQLLQTARQCILPFICAHGRPSLVPQQVLKSANSHTNNTKNTKKTKNTTCLHNINTKKNHIVCKICQYTSLPLLSSMLPLVHRKKVHSLYTTAISSISYCFAYIIQSKVSKLVNKPTWYVQEMCSFIDLISMNIKRVLPSSMLTNNTTSTSNANTNNNNNANTNNNNTNNNNNTLTDIILTQYKCNK